MSPRIPGPRHLSGFLARLRSLWRGLRHRGTLEADMDEEFRHHIRLRTEDLARGGLSWEEASRRAHREFGHVETHKERARASRGLRLLDQVRFSWVDVKLGLRMLVKHPVLTIVAGFALAVGIPVGLAPLHLSRAIEAPLPEDGGDRVRAIRYWNLASTGVQGASYFEYTQWRDELTTFSALGAERGSTYTLVTGDGVDDPVLGAQVTASTFDILGTPPLLGRTLRRDDEVPGAPDVVLVGHDLWRSRLGSDPDVVGRTIRLGGVPHTVVGVMPKGFLFPMQQQLWVPLRETYVHDPAEGLPVWVFGRLADGVTPEQANAEVLVAGRRMADAFPDSRGRLRAEVVPFGLTVIGVGREGLAGMPEFYVFQLIALVLLGVSCANVSMLLFARTATRLREIAVRTALGAGRLRIVAQMFAESLVLAIGATGVGLFAADQIVGRVFAVILRTGTVVPYWLDLGLTWEAVVQGLALAVLSAGFAGVLPALKVTGKKVQQNLQRTGAGRSGLRFGGGVTALIVADVALAVAVIGFAAALSDVVRAARHAGDRVGIPAEEYLAAELRLPANGVTGAGNGADLAELTARWARLQQTVVARLEAEPGVLGVAAADALPRMNHRSLRVEVEGGGTPGEERGRFVRVARIDPGFFASLEQPILAGRAFDRADPHTDGGAVIVNTTFVEAMLGGRNAVGRRIRFLGTRAGAESPWYEVVGVVGHLGMNILSPDNDAGLYLSAAPGLIRPLQLGIHLGVPPETFVPRLREIVSSVDATAVLRTPRPLDEIFQGDWYLTLGVAAGLVLLVGILLALAASGLYAIMSFAVSERTREIGIRTALGAPPGAIALAITRRALWQIGLGGLLGAPMAAFFFVQLRDDSSLAVSSVSTFLAALVPGLVVMVLVALVACTAPTLRAMRVEPTEALRGAD